VKLILLVAKAKNRVIGKDNQLIWKLSADLKRFKHLTTGHFLLMGRKTYESLGRPLPNRTHLIITRNSNFKAPEGHFVFHSVEEALIFCTKRQMEKLFVIGGGEIYKEALPLCNVLEITEVEASPEGDTFILTFGRRKNGKNSLPMKPTNTPTLLSPTKNAKPCPNL